MSQTTRESRHQSGRGQERDRVEDRSRDEDRDEERYEGQFVQEREVTEKVRVDDRRQHQHEDTFGQNMPAAWNEEITIKRNGMSPARGQQYAPAQAAAVTGRDVVQAWFDMIQQNLQAQRRIVELQMQSLWAGVQTLFSQVQATTTQVSQPQPPPAQVERFSSQQIDMPLLQEYSTSLADRPPRR